MAYARKLGVQNIEVIPVAALVGVNVVSRGTKETPWYTGRTLLEALEGIEAGRTDLLKELRFPIQLVSRPDANFRGYAGTIASGEISVGDAVLALPSRKSSKVREITTADGPLEKAGTHQAVTIVLEDEIDLSRGDVLVHPDHRPTLARTFDANLIWMGEAPLLPGKRYEFKIGSRYVKGLVDSIQHRIDVNDLTTRSAEALDLNGLARVRIALEEPVAVDDYKLSRATGSFIIIDLLHFGTVGAGMVIAPANQAGRASTDVVWQPTRVTAAIRANQKSQKPAVVWFTGLSGSGKSTIANALEQALVQRGHHSYLLDGDNIRHGLNIDLDFSEGGRNENIRRVGEVSALFVDAGLIVITAFISPFRADRNSIRERIGDAQFIEVYLSTSLEECERRDPKGLYVKARAGEIREFTGIDSPYEPPIAPQLTIDTSKQEIGASVDQILRYLENKGFLHQADPVYEEGTMSGAVIIQGNFPIPEDRRDQLQQLATELNREQLMWLSGLLRRRRRGRAVQHSRVPGQSAGWPGARAAFVRRRTRGVRTGSGRCGRAAAHGHHHFRFAHRQRPQDFREAARPRSRRSECRRA